MNALDIDSIKRFAVFGLGASGLAAANLLARRGKEVVASDLSTSLDVVMLKEKLDASVEVVLGSHPFDGVDCVVISPGLKPSLTLFREIPSEVAVIPEIELARACSNHRWLGVTGTDGKTTTTELTAHILNEIGESAIAAGNIGTPLCDVVDKASPETIIVAELSGFQLWSIKDFFIESMALTNIAQDHLDYFDRDMSSYVRSKLDIFLRNNAIRTAVLNLDEPLVKANYDEISRSVPSVVTYGSSDTLYKERKVPHLIYNEQLEEIIFPTGDLLPWGSASLVGRHNAFNAMAAAALAYAIGVGFDACIGPICGFQPSEHRVEIFGVFDGVRWINDSKATNTHASRAGLEAIKGGVVVIVGGVDKNLGLEDYVEFLKSRADAVVVMGAIRERLISELKGCGFEESRLANAGSLEEAVDLASRFAKAGRSVVLSPACSSFDMFSSYEDRGIQFKSLVREKFGTRTSR